MKVIFLENVETNKIGEVKEVSDGYARNFLLKKRLAVVATPEEIRKVEEKLSKLQADEEKKVKEAEKNAEELSKISLEIKVEASPEDTEGNRKLFGSVTNSDISDLLAEKGHQVDKKDIETGDKINEVGEYQITIKLGHGVSTTIPLKVSVKE